MKKRSNQYWHIYVIQKQTSPQNKVRGLYRKTEEETSHLVDKEEHPRHADKHKVL